MVDEGVITKREAVARIEPAQVDQLLRATSSTRRAQGRDQDRQRASTPRRARRSAGPCSTPTRAVEWVERGEKVDPRPDRDLARRLPRHGRGRRASSPPAAAPPRTPRSSRARSASRASPARADLIVDYAGKQRALQRHRHRVQGRRLGQPRRHDRRAVPRRAADGRGAVRGPARAPEDPRLGRRDPPAGRLDQRRQARGGRPGPRATAPRASACAAPSTCSARATGSRSCAARSSSRTQATRAKAKAAAGETLDADEAEAVATFDAAMAKLEVLQQGDFEGIFKAMDGLPVVIRLIDPPLHEFLPNLEEQLVKVTKRRGDGGATEEDKELLRDDQVDARAEPDARPARLPPRADDPGLREDPDPGHPQRRRSRSSRPAATRSPRS